MFHFVPFSNFKKPKLLVWFAATFLSLKSSVFKWVLDRTEEHQEILHARVEGKRHETKKSFYNENGFDENDTYLEETSILFSKQSRRMKKKYVDPPKNCQTVFYFT